MATAKNRCITCGKEKVIVKCEGCSNSLCYEHLMVHRQELNKTLDTVEVSHDLLRQSLSQQSAEPQQHEMIKRINEWEQKSIIKIKNMAEESRAILLQHTTKHLNEVKVELDVLTNQLRQSRQSNDFTEIDLREWESRLKKLQEELVNPSKFSVREDSAMLVAKLYVGIIENSDTFERTFGNATFEQDSKVVVKDSSTGHTEVRGKNEYSSGQRILRFKIEKLPLNGWIAFGIISKSTPLQHDSYLSVTNYGWSNQNQGYAAGSHSSGKGSEVIENDSISLLIDCEHRTIQLINDRTQRTIELPVDINKCSFPWQLHLNLHASQTRVRILT